MDALIGCVTRPAKGGCFPTRVTQSHLPRVFRKAWAFQVFSRVRIRSGSVSTSEKRAPARRRGGPGCHPPANGGSRQAEVPGFDVRAGSDT